MDKFKVVKDIEQLFGFNNFAAAQDTAGGGLNIDVLGIKPALNTHQNLSTRAANGIDLGRSLNFEFREWKNTPSMILKMRYNYPVLLTYGTDDNHNNIAIINYKADAQFSALEGPSEVPQHFLSRLDFAKFFRFLKNLAIEDAADGDVPNLEDTALLVSPTSQSDRLSSKAKSISSIVDEIAKNAVGEFKEMALAKDEILLDAVLHKAVIENLIALIDVS